MGRWLPLVLVAMLAGCTAPMPPVEFTHVHDAVFVPSEGALFLGTHYGVVVGTEARGQWTWTYDGDERYDYMGLTQDGVRDNVFYASGHPNDPRAYGGVHLGLRRSLDGAETWEQRSLKAEVDFHALTGFPGRADVVAGAWQGIIKHSIDGGATWRDIEGPAPVITLAAAKETLFAATTAGLFATADLTNLTRWQSVFDDDGAPFSSLAASPDGLVLFASTGDHRAGDARHSTDGGATWAPINEPVLASAKSPVAFAFDPSDARHVFASTSGGRVFESQDGGLAWTAIRIP